MHEDEMMMEDEMLGEEMLPETQPVGAFESMMQGNMPDPAELADLLGDGGPSFHDSLASENPPLNSRGTGMGGSGLEMAAMDGPDYTGQKSYDPELVKQDVRALLNQRAQERQAASAEFQSRAQEITGGSGY